MANPTDKEITYDELIERHSQEYADQIRHAADFADKEEEIRIESERLLAFLAKDAGIELKGKHEYTIGRGRTDSVYKRVIIEYKNPGDPAARLGPGKDAPGNEKVVKQIKDRFRGLQEEAGQELDSLFGVGLDGHHFIFVTYRDNDWRVEPPVPVTPQSAARFLWALFNLGRKGKPFRPDYLAGDFGSATQTYLARDTVCALYNAICSVNAETHPKAAVLFGQWKILFSEVCGYDVDNPSGKILELADAYTVSRQGLRPPELLFALQTYFAVFMKLLAAEIMSFFHKMPRVLQAMVGTETPVKLMSLFEDLEAGGVFRKFGITNFLEGDLYAWYTDVWPEHPAIEAQLRKVVTKLDEYNPGTLAEQPEESRDLLKKLYHELFPRSVRHDLGEYYTPDWLAEHVLNELGYEGQPDTRILDPACGSGTFLVLAISRVIKWFQANRETMGYEKEGLLRRVLNNVVGFDLNPLAVLAARTNYLIAVRDLISYGEGVEIPVYLCDSILTPSEYGGLFQSGGAQGAKLGAARELKTAAGSFYIPSEIVGDRGLLARYAEELERAVRGRYSADEFIARLAQAELPAGEEQLHRELFSKMVELDKEKRNGVWARIIKNAFAPLFCGQFDYIAGNPPWVNWESLPSDYRDMTKPLWQTYGLFSLSGTAGRLGGGKKDVSMLMTYVALHHYLNQEGRLGFVITQSIFKTQGAGDGFRRFKLPDRHPGWIQPYKVHDLSALQVFEGATNRTSVFMAELSSDSTKYPIPYILWKGPSRIDPANKLEDVLKLVELHEYLAAPSDGQTASSVWLTATPLVHRALKKIQGVGSAYQAYAGCCTWLNGVYWVNILSKLPSGEVHIQNNWDIGKIKVEKVNAVVEPTLLHPLLRGRDIGRWSATPSRYIILTQDPHTRKGIPETAMKLNQPKSYAYLKQFEGELEKPLRGTLRGRSGFKQYFKPTDPFYSVYNVGEHSLSTYRVGWGGEVATKLEAAVIRPDAEGNVVLSDQTAYHVPVGSEEEGHYLCALLNSAPVTAYYRAVAYKHTSMGFIRKLRIDKFDPSNLIHVQLAQLSKAAHQGPDAPALAKIESDLDKAAMEYFGLTTEELFALRAEGSPDEGLNDEVIIQSED